MEKVQGVPQPMGVTIENGRVNFAVSVPGGKSCDLLLYRKGEQVLEQSVGMPEDEALGEVRFLALKGMDPSGYEYNFMIDGEIKLDPFVRAVSEGLESGLEKKAEAGQKRGCFQMDEFDWEGDRGLSLPYHEVIAYSLHIRGFTMHSSSKVKHRGTFAGVIEKLPYLKELGINQIQCMPVYEFEDKVGKVQNYWGYGPGYYFAPKASYSASGNPVRELKEMVKSCHKGGIEVILEMPFTEDILPQDAVACLKYYVLEYHVDGFVLNPYHVPMEGIKRDPMLKGVKILKKEEWYQNVMRRFLKGDEGMVQDVIWALRHNSQEDGCCNYITAQTGFTMYDLVSYDGKHNEANGENNQDGPQYNYSWNCGAEGATRKKAVVELRKKQMRNAFFLLMTSQGTPCILAGDEFENSQGGNNNVYCQDNELSWLNWNKLCHKDSLFPFVKELIALRKQHPILHRAESLLGLDQISCGIPDVSYHGESAWQIPSDISSRQLGVLYSGGYQKDTECFIAYNMHWLEHVFALPALNKKKKWYQVMSSAKGAPLKPGLLPNQRMLEVQARSIVLLIGK